MFKTLNFKLIPTSEQRDNILSLQKSYSVAFRKAYNNLDLIEDPGFKSEILGKYIHSAKAYEYLVKEVIAFHDVEQARKKDDQKKVDELNEELKGEKCGKKRQKIQRKISSLENSIKSKPTFGGKTLLRTLTRQRQRIDEMTKSGKKSNRELYGKNIDEFREARIREFVFHGEASRGGNRFFDVSELHLGKIRLKLENTSIVMDLEIEITSNTRRALLKKIVDVAKTKILPLTISLSRDVLRISFEETILNGTYFNKKQLFKDIKHITDELEKKKEIAKAHREHEKRVFGEKMPNRYCGIDQNPEGIGFIIADKISDSPSGEMKIIHKGFIDFSKLAHKKVPSDKRGYELSIAMRDLFSLLNHHKVTHFAVEDLDNIGGNKSSREGNRKINNIWQRKRTMELCQKHCDNFGMKLIKVIPAYSSFIGNIRHNEYDPVAAAIEICRRGMVKFIKKGEVIPTFQSTDITDAAHAAGMDYALLESAGSWKGLWGIISTAEKSVRRVGLETFSFKHHLQNRTDKSKTKVLLFH